MCVQERLECLSRPVMSASQPKNLGRVGAFIGPKTMGELAQHEDNMQQSLAPLLHKDRRALAPVALHRNPSARGMPERQAHHAGSSCGTLGGGAYY